MLTLAVAVAAGAACTPGSSCCVRHPRAASCGPSKSRNTQPIRPPQKEATPQDGKRTTCGWASGCCRRKPVECRDASHLRIAPTPSHTHCPAGGGGGAPCCAGTPVHMRIGKTGSKSITMSKPSRLSLRPAGSPEASFSANVCPSLPQAPASLGQSALGWFWPGFGRPSRTCFRHRSTISQLSKTEAAGCAQTAVFHDLFAAQLPPTQAKLTVMREPCDICIPHAHA